MGLLLAWINRRHPNKSNQWKRKRYFRYRGRRDWVFYACTHDQQGNAGVLDLRQTALVAIVRHVKIRAAATPYDPAFVDYLARRKRSKRINPLAWHGTVVDAHVSDGQRHPRTEAPGQVNGS